MKFNPLSTNPTSEILKDSEILKFEYLKNARSFWNEIKNAFPSFKSTLFRLKKNK